MKRAAPLLVVLALLAPLSGCTLISAAWNGVFGGDEEPTDVRTEQETDMAVLHELVHRGGEFHPELVLEPNDVEPLEKMPATEPSAPPLPDKAATDAESEDAVAVAAAHNPPTTRVAPAAVRHAGALDFAFEVGVMAGLAMLLAGALVMAVRRPAVLALLLSVVAIGVATRAWLG